MISSSYFLTSVELVLSFRREGAGRTTKVPRKLQLWWDWEVLFSRHSLGNLFDISAGSFLYHFPVICKLAKSARLRSNNCFCGFNMSSFIVPSPLSKHWICHFFCQYLWMRNLRNSYAMIKFLKRTEEFCITSVKLWNCAQRQIYKHNMENVWGYVAQKIKKNTWRKRSCTISEARMNMKNVNFIKRENSLILKFTWFSCSFPQQRVIPFLHLICSL